VRLAAAKLKSGVRGRFITKVICALALLLSGACVRRTQHAPVIAEAYVGPATLRIRSDLPLQSATVATAKHGERVDIIQRRRKFMRVRTKGGAEGWTEENQLLNAAEMGDLKDLAARAAKLPSQGLGTSFSALNVHTQPAAGSPSFLQIKEGEKFDVLVDIVTPHLAVARQTLIPPAEKKAPAPRKAAKQAKIPPPPLPAAPPPPANWLELSKTDEEDEAPPEEPEAKPVPNERWSLIRAAGGPSGWVLTRRINMAIPDEVAQYAEGRRIVAYFPLGYVQDENAKKAIWLWATSGGAHEGYDFDSFRVFIWNLRRHRYETAYIERNLEGYLPVLAQDVDYAVGGKVRGQPAAPAKYPGFSICTRKADGQLHRRDFALLGNVVRSAGEESCQLPAPVWVAKAAAAPGSAAPVQNAASPRPAESLSERIKSRIKRLFKKDSKTESGLPAARQE
jgi:hypothetical protein